MVIRRTFRISASRLAASLVIALSLPFVARAAYAAAPAEQYNLGKDRVAIKGFDPVSYFRDTGPLKGRKDVAVEHDGVVYRFATEENKKAFTTDPAKYKPTYGGWCAKAIADGEKVDIDPKNYKITDGRLFLFYKGILGDALKVWNKDEANLTRKADAQWKRIAGE
jgi:hypothetical protein